MPALAQELNSGLLTLGLTLSSEQQQRLLDYMGLLIKWNKVYNLTAVREPQPMLHQHLLDCLAAVPPLQQRFPGACNLLDVGAGGGLPSVVLAGHRCRYSGQKNRVHTNRGAPTWLEQFAKRACPGGRAGRQF